MAQIQIKRGLETNLVIGASGEPLWTTDTKKLFISDGVSNYQLQNLITLTTIGTSGVATLIANVLNIPNYASSTGTVETISVATINGFAGTSDGDPANPELTIFTTETGILKGNGTAISAAISGTDYIAGGSGIANEIAYFTATGVVNSLAVATYPSLTELTYLKGITSAIQTQINAKGVGSVTSVAQSFTGGLISVGGSPVTTNGTLALTVAGTSGGIPYFSSSSAWASSAALSANALMIGGGAGATPSTITTGIGVLTALGVNVGSVGSFVILNGVLGTPSSGTLTNCTFPTLNQNTSGSAASLSISGQTGLLTFVGLTNTNRAKTVRDAADTILELGGSYTPTGNWSSLTMITPVLGTPTSGNLANCTFPTLNQNTTGTAAALTTARTVGGVNFDGTANIVPQTIQTINEATDTTCFPLFITTAGTQSLQPLNNAGFIYNSNTNALTATTFIGALTGTASGNLVSGGALGTPSSGTLTNTTGLPLTTGLIGGTWKTIYTDGSGVVVELALGASGKVLTTNGASSAPTWETPTGGANNPLMVQIFS